MGEDRQQDVSKLTDLNTNIAPVRCRRHNAGDHKLMVISELERLYEAAAKF